MELHNLLQELAESPGPRSTVDVSRAAAQGRRTVRLRRFAVGGSAALAVVAIVSAVTFTVGGGTASPPPIMPGVVDSPSASPSVASRPLPAAAPDSFDPRVQYAQVGWVPDGARGTSVTLARDWLAVTTGYQGLPTGNSNEPSPGQVTLLVATAGHGIDPMHFNSYAVDPGQMRPGQPADPVNGGAAEWVDGYGTTLRWQYAPGAWAVVVVHNLTAVDARDVARRVASDVSFGVDFPVTLPFTAAVPGAFSPVEVTVSRHPAGWSAQVAYAGADGARTQYQDWPLVIGMHLSAAETGDGSVIGDPNTTLDGFPARTSSGVDGGAGLQVFNVNGVYIEMLTHSPQATSQLPGGLTALFRSMKIFTNITDWK